MFTPLLPTRLALRIAVCLLGILAVTACRNPRTGDVYTLNSPADVDGVEICIYPDDGVWIAAHAPNERCTHASALSPTSVAQNWEPFLYFAAISNLGESALQVYTLDTRSTIWLTALRSPEGTDCLAEEVAARQPAVSGDRWFAETNGDSPCSSIAGDGIRAFDNDRATPGNNGIHIDGQMGANVASHFAGVQWVAANAPASLTAVDVLTGRKIPNANGALQQRLPFPIADIASVHEGGWVIVANPQDNELVAYQPTFTCAGQSDEHIVGCRMTVELGAPLYLPVTGSPRHIVASAQGDVYVSADRTPFITRYTLNDDACPAGSPCEIPLTTTCNDGIDNDGNGLIDAEDPSCFAPYMNEGELFPDAGCADGVDNDGDGLIDALDPKCVSRSYQAEDGLDNSCTDGIDNDGDGLVDDEDPDCANGSEFRQGTEFTPSSGVAIPRYTSQPVYPGPLTLTPDGDILIVAEGGGTRHEESSATDLVFICGRPIEPADGRPLPSNHACATPNTLIQQNAGDPSRDKGVGLRINAAVNGLVATTRFEHIPVRPAEGLVGSDPAYPAEYVQLLSRRVYAMGADAYLYAIDVDRYLGFADSSGAPLDVYEPLFRFTDGNNSYADVRNMRLQRAERLPSLPITGSPDQLQPALRAIAPEQLNSTIPEDQRLHAGNLNTPEAFIQLPREERYCFQHERLGCVTNPPRDNQFYPYNFSRLPTSVKHDARVFDENWTLAWEGSLLIGQTGVERTPRRNDAVLESDDGWIRFLSDNACDTVNGDSSRLCEMNVGWSVCPALEDLCQRGADLCSDDLDLCEICPSACSSPIDLCAAGVQPGDIAIIPPLDPGAYCRRGDEGCSNDNKPAKCLPGFGNPQEPGAYDLPIPGIVTVGNEYRVVEVRGDAFRVEPLNFNDRARYRLPSTLPSTDCYRRTFTVEVVAANAWTLSGARVAGTDTPYREIDGVCAYEVEVDDNLRNWRPVAGQRLLTRFGFEFELIEGDYLEYCRTQASDPEECAHAMRGFRVHFTTEDNLTPRALSGVIGAMGISGGIIQNLNLLRVQLLFLDFGNNELAVVEDTESMRGTIVP